MYGHKRTFAARDVPGLGSCLSVDCLGMFVCALVKLTDVASSKKIYATQENVFRHGAGFDHERELRVRNT